MLHVLRNLALAWQCDRVCLLEDHQRVSLNLWRRLKIKSRYDEIWLEAGAVRGDHGFLELHAVGPKVLDLSTVESRKRAETARRIALLNRISADVSQRFAPRTS